MEKLIELEESDDITAIRSRIELILSKLSRQTVHATDNKERVKLLLVVPKKNKALDNLVNMKLLARQARAPYVELGILTDHPKIRDYAKEAGLKTFTSFRTAKWAGWITDQTDVTPATETLPPAISTFGDRIPIDVTNSQVKRKRVQKKKYKVVKGNNQPGSVQQMLQQLGILALIVVLAVAVVTGAVALLPQATVTITPLARPVETELLVKADPDVNSVNFRELTFPARIDQVELKLFDEIETIKTELAPSGRASGRVVFINRIEEPQFVPINTAVTTSAGDPIEFTTTISATIPAGIGATSDPVPVIAQEPGPRGNLSAGQLNRFADGAYGITARVVNETATGGGALEPARIVEESDKERLMAHLRQKIQQEGLEQLKATLGEQEFIPPQSVQVIVLDVKYREFSGDFSDTFGGEMQAVVRATVVGGYNANRLALAALETQVPPGYELDLEGLQFGAGEVLDLTDGIVTFEIFASGQAVPTINGREVARDVVGLSIGEAQNLLEKQYELATVPGVDLRPDWLVDWLGRLPFSAFRIDVVINDAVVLMADGS